MQDFRGGVSKVAYSVKYDANYDTRTGNWLDGVCDDPECSYCANRPGNAFDVSNEEVCDDY